MPNEWRRGISFVTDDNRADSGHFDILKLDLNETLAATWWSTQIQGFYQGDTHPTAASPGVWGLILYNALGDPPDPISDPGADWIDRMPVVWDVGYYGGASPVWTVASRTGYPERKARAQRRNDTSAILTLAVCWHFYGAGSAPGWLDNLHWSVNVSSYILNVNPGE